MDKSKIKTEKRLRRHNRIRAKIKGTVDVPRLSVFKSNTSLYAQIIDDVNGKTLVSLSLTAKMKDAKKLGEELAKKAIDSNIKKVVFDRGGYIYTGKIKDLAEGAREGGLVF
jgi:large subunit ribosomal protein L18